jgi:hypothetical protein
MERILNRLQNAPREQLRARMDREPFPLYELLRQRGFRCHATALNDGSFEVVIEPAA